VILSWSEPSRVSRLRSIPVAIVEPIGATLVPAGADQAFDIGPPLVLVLDATHHDDPKIARFPGHIQQ